jgi:hypothetical protein
MMKLLTVVLLLFLVACKQKQVEKESISASLSIAKAAAVKDSLCERFYDSLVALADTPVTNDEIALYKHLYTQKEIHEKGKNLTYPKIEFRTDDADWNRQLNKEINNQVKELITGWRTTRAREVKEFAIETRRDWNDFFYTVEITPHFVSQKWVTVQIGYSTYTGGMGVNSETWFSHYERDNNGTIKEVKQPDIFIYDKDTSISYRRYNTLLKGMDNEFNCLYDSTITCLQKEYYCTTGFSMHDIKLNYFIDTENIVSEEKPYTQEFYLVPAKTGLKTKPFLYVSSSPRYSLLSDYKSDYIIPYKSLKGIVKEKYLKMWMAE